MRTLAVTALSVLTLLSVPNLLLVAQEAPAPKTHEGTLECVQATDLKVELKNYGGELRLKQLAAAGTFVRKGDLVAELDATDYERQMTRAAENVRAADWALELARAGLEHAKGTAPLALERARREAERAEEAQAFYLAKDKANRIRLREMDIESSQFNIQDQEEELAQLEKLYQGNDLAKESQDIVLNRSKRRLKQTKERFEMQKANFERFKSVELPRYEADLDAEVRSARLELARVQKAVEQGQLEAEIRFLRAGQGAEDARKARADLEADKAAFRVVAPHDGLVLAGGLEGNGISGGPKVGDKVRAGQSLAGLVDTARLCVTVNVPAAERARFAPGAAVQVTSDDGIAVPGAVSALSPVVRRGNVAVTVQLDNADGKLLLGLKVTVKAAQ